MKRSIPFLVTIALAFIFAACDSGADAPPSDDITPVPFEAKAGFFSRYDQYAVDTSDASGNNPDKLIQPKVTLIETVDAVGLTFAGRTGVSRHISTPEGGGNPDTMYFSQDANGDLYRYNYGFSILNNFPDLEVAIGQRVDMGWVLVARLGKKEGAAWIAKDSSLPVQFLSGKSVFFKSSARMLADTSIMVGDSLILCRAAEHVITAKATIASTDDVKGEVRARTYISGKYGKVVFDFIRSGKFEGIYQGKFRGLYKIMTFHE